MWWPRVLAHALWNKNAGDKIPVGVGAIALGVVGVGVREKRES